MKNSRLLSIIIHSFIATTLFIASCDWPFNTKVSDGDIFEISVIHDIKRVMPHETLILVWEEVTVDGTFDKYRIERKLINDTSWTLVVDINDYFLTSYIDTIYDDDDLLYRVSLVTNEGYELWDTESTEIPNTDSIFVPTEIDTIFNATRSPLVDDGDIVFVEPGYYAENIFILGKDIILKSTDGSAETIIDGMGNNSAIGLQNSIIDGFTIIGGATRRIGGGVIINGDGVVKNCIIKGNYAEGMGGGVYIDGDGSIYNTIIDANLSPVGDGIYIKDGHGEIVNNTMIGNDVFIDGNCDGLLLRNNIFYQSNPDISFANEDDKDGVIMDYSRFDSVLSFASNSITSDPLFSNLDNFEISNNSPCSDTGHPDEQYNDIDGSRNDMGAYGGPTR